MRWGGETIMDFAYVCLDCDRVFYVVRYRDGETLCPRCGGRVHVPLSALLPPVEARAFIPGLAPEKPAKEVRL